jgi:glutathione synthase/RimK-type ligase-like ATP-grasp enzyme
MSRSQQTLNLLQAWQALGLYVANSASAVLGILNRPLLFSILQNSGLSIPKTLWCRRYQAPEGGKWILKSPYKSFRDIRDTLSVSKSDWCLYQDFIPFSRHVKTYLVGRENYTEVTSECLSASERISIKTATLECQKILGLELLSIDFVLTADKYYIVDVNDFPSFDQVEEAPKWIADYLIRKLIVLSA